MFPTSKDFQAELENIFRQAQSQNMQWVEVQAGDLHRQVGGYPARNHHMPVCCQVLRANMQAGDQILAAPPKGNGATLLIRYHLPR